MNPDTKYVSMTKLCKNQNTLTISRMRGSKGGGGQVLTPSWKNHKVIGFFSITGPNPLTINKATKVRKRAKIMNQYNQAPHLTKDTTGKVTTSQLDITNESQEVNPFAAGDQKESINRRTQKHNKTRQK